MANTSRMFDIAQKMDAATLSGNTDSGMNARMVVIGYSAAGLPQ